MAGSQIATCLGQRGHDIVAKRDFFFGVTGAAHQHDRYQENDTELAGSSRSEPLL
jgi:hypothetical protein